MTALVDASDEQLEAALEYRRRRWTLIPVEPRGKRPHAAVLAAVHGSPKWGPLGARPASTAEIRAWFDHDPAANIAILTGQASGGLVVADFDCRPRGLLHPPTPIVGTSRGTHAYFRADRPQRTIRTRWGDLKADGGYVLAPLSEHPDGTIYQWLIAPDDVGVAPLAALRDRNGIAAAHLSPGRDDQTPLGSAYDLPRGATGNALATVESAVQAALPFIGPGVRLHGPFSCVLPGHRDARPSASLYRDPRTGVWRYRDWHALESRREWWSLAEVYASVTAAQIRLRAPSASRWYDRLFWRAGVLHAPPPPVVPLPARSAPILHRVAVGFAELLTLRAVRDPGEPVVYTRTFAAPWCGVGVDQAKRAIAELRRLDVLRKVGETQEGNPRFFLYELGTGPRRRRHPTLADGARRTAKVGEAPAR